MNNFESLEQMYIRLAYECKERGDMFGHSYYMMRAFEVSCYE